MAKSAESLYDQMQRALIAEVEARTEKFRAEADAIRAETKSTYGK